MPIPPDDRDAVVVICYYDGVHGAPPCTGSVTRVVKGFYKNHRPKEAPPHVVDAILVCRAHAHWHEEDCRQCYIDYVHPPSPSQ